MSNPNSPVQIMSDDDSDVVAYLLTSPKTPSYMPVSATHVEKTVSSDETEPFEDDAQPFEEEIEPMEAETEPMEDETEPMEDVSKPTEDNSDPKIFHPSPIIPTPTAPTHPTQPEPAPALRSFRPGGPRLMRTPRITVLPPVTETFPISPTEISPIPPTVTTNTTTRRVRSRKWTWMQERIQAWRDEEGVPVILEVGESSTTVPIPPLTLEPVQHTVPVLVARLVDHERRLDHLDYELDVSHTSEVETLQARTSEVEGRIGYPRIVLK